MKLCLAPMKLSCFTLYGRDNIQNHRTLLAGRIVRKIELLSFRQHVQ